MAAGGLAAQTPRIDSANVGSDGQGYGLGAKILFTFPTATVLVNLAPSWVDTVGMSAVGASRHHNLFGAEFDSVLSAAQAGAPWALRRMYDTFGGAVLGYARAQGSPDPEALVNDVFARAFRRFGTFSGDETAFRSWVFTIAHNALVDARRYSSRRVVATREPTDRDVRQQAPSAEDEAVGSLEHEAVLAVLSSLPSDQREVLMLRLLGDMTVAQVAQVQGRSIGAVKALQRRGLARLRAIVGQGVPL